MNSELKKLPENWCVLPKNEEEFIVIKNWLKEKDPGFWDFYESFNEKLYITCNYCWTFIADSFIQITFEQFKKYVLKEETMEIDKVNDEFIVDCTKNTIEERREVYKFLVENRDYPKTYLTYDYKIIVCNKNSGDSNWGLLEIAKKYYPDYPVYTFEQFKEKYLMENNKKIIGYKLIKPEYREAVSNIVGFNYNFNVNVKYDHSLESINDKLKNAGVLDLWFEPVYEEEFKENDLVTDDYGKIVYVYSHFIDGKHYAKKALNYPKHSEFNPKISFGPNLRLATKEEIERAKIQLPTIAGHDGKYENDFIIYGCAKFHKDFFRDIYNCNYQVNKSEKQSNGNRTIKSIKLNSAVEITIDEIKQIVNYINFKDNAKI